MVNFKKKQNIQPVCIFSSKKNPLCVVMMESQTLSLCRGTGRKKISGNKREKRRRNPSDPRGRGTYLYIWVSSRDGSVWNVIHKHYSLSSPFPPSPAEERALLSEPLWVSFPQHSPPSVGSIRGLTGIWLLPCFIKHTCLQPSQACLSVKRLIINRTFPGFLLLSTEMQLLNKQLEFSGLSRTKWAIQILVYQN